MKGTTKEVTSQEEGFLNFLRPLISARIPLVKNLPAPPAKIFLVPLGLMAAASVTDVSIKKVLLDEACLHVYC